MTMTMTWTDRAACKGLPSRIFFPARGGSYTLAKQICARCPVRDQCAQAGADEPRGIWGGTTPADRGKTNSWKSDPHRINEVAVCPHCERRHWVHQARINDGKPCPECKARAVA